MHDEVRASMRDSSLVVPLAKFLHSYICDIPLWNFANRFTGLLTSNSLMSGVFSLL